MNPNPSSLLPPQAVASMVRQGGDPNSLFQQNPLAQNMTPDAMGGNPSLMQPPPPGSQAQTPGQPPMPPPQAGMAQPQAGVPGQEPQMSEAEMILNALSDRLAHHSKITEKTIAAITSMIDANQQVPGAQPAA